MTRDFLVLFQKAGHKDTPEVQRLRLSLSVRVSLCPVKRTNENVVISLFLFYIRPFRSKG